MTPPDDPSTQRNSAPSDTASRPAASVAGSAADAIDREPAINLSPQPTISESSGAPSPLPLWAESPLLGSLDADDWMAFSHYLERATFPAGTAIVEESAEGQEMYFIIEGVAHLRRGQINLGVIGRGDHFGELALIARRVRAASVISITRIVTERLTRKRYEDMSAEAPGLALRFTQALVSSLGVRLTEMTDSVGLLLRERSLPRRTLVDVRVGGTTRKVRTGTPVRTLLPLEDMGSPVVAALLNQKVVSLNTPVTSDLDLSALTAGHWEGKRVYRQSLGLVVLEAARRVDSSIAVSLGPSFGFGQRVHCAPVPRQGLDAWAAEVTAAMHDLVASGARFREELWTVEEARAHFVDIGWRDAALLLQTWRNMAVPLVSCGEVYALSIAPLLPDTSSIALFAPKLEVTRRGLFVHYGDEVEVSPAEIPPEVTQIPPTSRPNGARSGPGASRDAIEEEPFLQALGVTSVGAFNEACIIGRVSQIIRVSEGLHEKRIGQIADVIAGRAGRTRIVCIAGPSSSGKTTFIKRLMVQLQVNGVHPVAISLDDYYLDRERTRRHKNGDYDYEALDALDLPLLHDHLARLALGEAVNTARYNFTTGKSSPTGGPTIALGPSDVLMLEGIHGLNPKLFSATLDQSQIFRIFIQPMSSLPFDRLTRVNVSDIRLLRRIVRDRHHRGTNAGTNILRWPAVREGEREHIFPYLDQADAVFDSALVYELSVTKVFADRYLLEVPQDHPAQETAHRLRQLIDRFITIYPDHVPPTSLLREFIGGSGFEY